MTYIPALPGNPPYNPKPGVNGILDSVRLDVNLIISIMKLTQLCFATKMPDPGYIRRDFVAVAVLNMVVTELHPKDRPFVVDFLYDPKTSLAVAKATGISSLEG